ncbi:MAG: TAXI family TRAP transporter solute-binding subunit [Fusobacteriaceae bacterium]|nr:TAXI family TRAP transporter solute-binding subunit [Fusobacteriaceae bacterium]
MRKVKRITAVLFALVLFLTAFTTSHAKYTFNPGDKVDKTVQFATLAVGSSWYVYGATVANVVTSHDTGLKIDVMPNSGGVGNMLLLKAGKADIGLGFNCTNAWAYKGILAFQESGAIPKLRGLVGTIDQMYVGIAIRNGAGFTRIRDIAEKKMPINVYTSETGSASEYTTRLVLESIGCSYEDIIKWGGSVTHTDFASIVAAYQDGKCDFFMQHVSVGHPAFTELCTTADVTVGELDEQSLEYLKGNGYSVATMPANSFNKQTKDVICAGITTNIVTTTDLPDEIAYRIVKQIYENPEELKTGHAGLGNFNREACATPELYGGFPLHPGAEKYYREIGLIK